MTIERIGERPSMPNGSRAPYSPMVRAGDFVYISGQLPGMWYKDQSSLVQPAPGTYQRTIDGRNFGISTSNN